MRFTNLSFSIIMCFTFIARCTNINTTSPIKSFSTQTLLAVPQTPILPTHTATPILTPTFVPALSVDEARQQLLNLLANNGGCRLPCLWGVTPRKSSNQEAQTILMPLSRIAETIYFDQPKVNGILLGAISTLYIEGDLRLNTRVAYVYGDDDIVSYIAFRVLEEKVVKDPRDPSGKSWISKTPIYGSTTFIKRVEYYSLSHLLSEQGIPDSVMISTSAPSFNRSGSVILHLAVFYPNQGIWTEYTTSTNENEVGSVIRSCPANAHIQMNLYPPGNPDSFYALLEQSDWGVTKNSYKLLEEVTSLSVKQFYEIFRNPTDKCIETTVDLWPTPER